MLSDTMINYKLFDCVTELEKIDRLIIQLQLRREAVLKRQAELKAQLREVQSSIDSSIDLDNWNLAQKMKMNLLNEHLSK